MQSIGRFERIDVRDAMLTGFFIDVVTMFGLWPALGEPFPTLGQAVITIIFGQLAGLFIIWVARVRKKR